MPREFSLLARTAVIRESDPRIDGLRSAMGNFYSTTTGYFAFDESSQQTQFWRGLLPCLDDAIASAKRENRRARVLEFGAGRTGFSEFLGERRPDVEFCVQDVTDRNRDHLDLRHLRKRYRIERLSIPTRGFKNWVWARYALLFVRIRPKNGG